MKIIAPLFRLRAFNVASQASLFYRCFCMTAPVCVC